MGKLNSQSLRLSHIWLYVKETKRSIKFYQDVVGLRSTETFPDGALFSGGGVLLGIHREEGDRKSNPGSTVFIFKTDNIEKDYKKLLKRGVIFKTPIRKEPYGRIASFKDPDGYLLEIVQENE